MAGEARAERRAVLEQEVQLFLLRTYAYKRGKKGGRLRAGSAKKKRRRRRRTSRERKRGTRRAIEPRAYLAGVQGHDPAHQQRGESKCLRRCGWSVHRRGYDRSARVVASAREGNHDSSRGSYRRLVFAARAKTYQRRGGLHDDAARVRHGELGGFVPVQASRAARLVRQDLRTRGAGDASDALGRRRVENGNGRGEGETRARRGREARRPGAAYPYLTQRALGREQVDGVEHAPTRARARERRPRRRV